MDERSRSTVPSQDQRVALPDQAVGASLNFTPDQLRDINLFVDSYFKSNRIPFSKDTHEGVYGVVVYDAIPRALSLFRRSELGPKDKMRVLIKQGLTLREEVRDHVREVLSVGITGLERQDKPFVGPYALPTGTAQAARGELQRFLYSPLISSDKINEMATYRRSYLPAAAGRVLVSVNSEFPDISIAQFPDPTDQAKILRNSMLSRIFRGTLSPVISIEELREFQEDSEGITKLAAAKAEEEFAELLLPGSPVPLSEQQKYLVDLYSQVLVAFAENFKKGPRDTEVSSDAIIFERDQIYKNFAPDFLLLHPALEETRLITNPDKAESGDNSLWREDHSVVIAGFRVPQIMALQRGARLAQAQGYAAERFTNAIRLWRVFENSKHHEDERRIHLSGEIEDIKREINTSYQGTGKIPSLAKILVQSRGDEAIHLRRSRNKHAKYAQLIDSARRKRIQVEDAYNLLKSPDGTFPDVIPTPDFLKSYIIADIKGRRGSSEKWGTKLVSDATELIAEERYGLREFGVTLSPDGFESMSIAEIDDILNAMKRKQAALKSRFHVPLPDFVLDEEILDIRAYVGRYAYLLASRPKSEALINDGNRSQSYSGLNLRLEKMSRDNASDEKIKRVFYSHSLKERIKILEYAKDGRQRLAFAIAPLEVPETVPGRLLLNWIKEVEISTVPINKLQSDESLAFQAAPLLTWKKDSENRSPLDDLPRVVLSREELRNQALLQLAAAKSVVYSKTDNKELELHARRIRRWFPDFLNLLNSPLFPVEEGVGMSMDRFMYLVSQRIKLLEALVNIEDSAGLYSLSEVMYRRKAIDLYRQYGLNHIKRLEDELHVLEENSPSVRRFLEGMGELNLLKLDESDDKQDIANKTN